MAYGYLDKIRLGKVSFNLYMKKRLSKLYPMFLISLFCMIVFQLIYASLNGGHWFSETIVMDNNIFTFVLDILCMQGMALSGPSFNQAAWFLSALILVYILFYFFAWIGTKYNIETVVFYLLTIIGVFGGIKGIPAIFGTFIDVRAFQGFFAGCLLCQICKMFKTIDKGWIREFIVICITIAIVAILIADAVKGDIIYGQGVVQVRKFVVIDVFIWPMIVFAVVNAKYLSQILAIKPLKFLGKISFCMYIIHYPLMVLAEIINQVFKWNLNYSSGFTFVGWICSVILCGTVCSHYIEDKFSALLRKKVDNEQKDI